MKWLIAPEGTGGVVGVGGVEIKVVDGVVEVDDSAVAHLTPHGFTEFVPGSADDPRTPEHDEATDIELAKASMNGLDRKQLFAVAKRMGVALTATMGTEAMREALKSHVDREAGARTIAREARAASNADAAERQAADDKRAADEKAADEKDKAEKATKAKEAEAAAAAAASKSGEAAVQQ